MDKPMIVSDEYREGYAAFYNGVYANPYQHTAGNQFIEWLNGYSQAFEDWCELIGEESV